MKSLSDGLSTAPLVVLCTVPAEGEVGRELAACLVSERLCACVTEIPAVTSTYRWEGRVCRDQEQLLVIKTTQDRLQALTDRIIALHPYAVPEVIALAIDAGHPAYLEWLRAQTR